METVTMLDEPGRMKKWLCESVLAEHDQSDTRMYSILDTQASVDVNPNNGITTMHDICMWTILRNYEIHNAIQFYLGHIKKSEQYSPLQQTSSPFVLTN